MRILNVVTEPRLDDQDARARDVGLVLQNERVARLPYLNLLKTLNISKNEDCQQRVVVVVAGSEAKGNTWQFSAVMPGACRVSTSWPGTKTWMAGTSPAMTAERSDP